ncbi:hypothetical protein HC031_25835 [Planosporangium thailandense]|uniref:Uncharacterized protein n=1 Tax=Planosporangium thailandense TaxID=765197 RepID=A0ABX0Y402_9ACTN|nr:hypothetical protein [Planosporangium thailandense]NJC73112.1 hypothetical protein [Planosporangium thailandense]
MLETAQHSLITGVRDALGVWAVLIALAAIGFAMMFAPGWRERFLLARVRASAAKLRHARNEARRRCAEELAVAAASAAKTAQRRHAAWVAADAATQKAWQAFEAADAAANRALRAAAFATADTEPDEEERSERLAFLQRAARGAYRRGELSAQQLADIVAGRNGFDPGRHPVELETLLLLAVRDHLLHAYRQASVAERAAWRDADIAVAAKTSLAAEAVVATEQAESPQQPLTVRIPRQRVAASTTSLLSLFPATR